jgi:hypothetical protein
MNMKLNVSQAVVILLVLIAVVVAVQTAITLVDVSTVPAGWQGSWVYIRAIVTGATATVLVTLLVNIGGYVGNVTKGNTEVVYEANQLGQTLARYTVYMTAFTGMILALTQGTPAAPYASSIAAGISVIVDVAKRSLDKIAASNSVATPVAISVTTTPAPEPAADPT